MPAKLALTRKRKPHPVASQCEILPPGLIAAAGTFTSKHAACEPPLAQLAGAFFPPL
jgi:hypothetical protein